MIASQTASGLRYAVRQGGKGVAWCALSIRCGTRDEGDFPEGIAVGYIEDFTSVQGSGFYNIRIRLATDFNNLNHVYVVDNHFKAEQDSLMRITEGGDE